MDTNTRAIDPHKTRVTAPNKRKARVYISRYCRNEKLFQYMSRKRVKDIIAPL
jgi:hypothetical protein